MARTQSPAAPRDSHRFPDAGRELTDNEIEARYGDFIRSTVAKMAQDVDVFVEMVRSANAIIQRRQSLAAHKETSRTSPHRNCARADSIAGLPAEVRALAVRLFSELGDRAAVARALNERGVRSARAGQWGRTSVTTLLKHEAERQTANTG